MRIRTLCVYVCSCSFSDKTHAYYADSKKLKRNEEFTHKQKRRGSEPAFFRLIKQIDVDFNLNLGTTLSHMLIINQIVGFICLYGKTHCSQILGGNF